MNFYKRYFNQFFAKSFLILASGTLLSQVVQILAYPFVTRFFTPEDFGVKAFFSMILILITSFSSGKYEEAILIPKEDEDAVHIIVISIGLSILVATLIGILGLFIGSDILDNYTKYDYYILVFFVPLGVIAIGIFNSLIHWSLRKNNFKSISKFKMIQSFSKSIFELSGGYFNGGGLVLVIGVILGMGGGIITFLIQFFKEINKLGIRIGDSFKKEKLLKIFNRYINFPRYSIGADLLHRLNYQMPIIFFTFYSTLEVIGHFSIAVLAAAIPFIIIIDSILKIFYSRMSSIIQYKRDQAQSYYIKILFLVTGISVIMGLIFLLFGRQLIIIVFGEQWYLAAQILPIYGFLILAKSWRSISYYVFVLLEKQENWLGFNFFRFFILSIGFLLLLRYEMAIVEIIKSYVIVMLITTLIPAVYAYFQLKNRKQF